MRERRRGWPLLALAFALVVAGVGVGAETGSRQVAAATWTSTEPGSPTGSRLEIEWRDPSNPDAQPPGIQTIIIELPPGSVIDDSAVPRCAASDAALLSLGAAACPAGSRIGGGTLVSDSGPSSPVPRYTTSAVTIFNGRGEQIALAETESGPPIRAVGRTKIHGTRLTAEIPSFPQGAPPERSLVALKRLSFRFDRVVRGGVAYARTPRVCPRGGAWISRLTFVYRDEVTAHALTASPCRRKRGRPRIVISGVPRGRCAADPFEVRVRITDASRLRRAILHLDRRRLRLTKRSSFAARVPVRNLRAGRHRLRVAARDTAGNAAVRAVGFRRCRG
jgi:hypothetical protein